MPAETVRLHISPLTPALLPTILGPKLTNLASNVSYGEIQTFPERNYGFVDLPATDAEQLKKKLSGAIFKGAKMKIDEARPKKRRRTEEAPASTEDARESGDAITQSATRKKKRKSAADNVVPGRELSPERKVKRAWTEPGQEKKKKSKKEGKEKVSVQQPSKFSEKEELLFRTKVPSNKADLVSKKPKKTKKAKHGAEELVVHEFEKTTKQPSFLKASGVGGGSNLTYEDGKGWVNGEGDVVEAEPAGIVQKRERSAKKKRKEKTSTKPVEIDTAQSAAADDKDLEVDEQASSSEPTQDVRNDDAAHDKSAGEGDKHTKDSVNESDAISEPDPAQQHSALEEQSHQSTNSPEVHPLESLFKKPRKPASQDVAKPSLEISTAFSFFDQDTDEDDMEPKMPLTPFTSQDLRSRGMRSAAPTPDTAYPSRFNSHDSARSSEGEDEDLEQEPEPETTKEGLDASTATPSKANDAAVSDFEKQFWEKRGDNNRAWKARRRAVLKEKRHRENRARRPKNW